MNAKPTNRCQPSLILTEQNGHSSRLCNCVCIDSKKKKKTTYYRAKGRKKKGWKLVSAARFRPKRVFCFVFGCRRCNVILVTHQKRGSTQCFMQLILMPIKFERIGKVGVCKENKLKMDRDWKLLFVTLLSSLCAISKNPFHPTAGWLSTDYLNEGGVALASSLSLSPVDY